MKKTLLALCAGVLALGATAQNFEKGKAFAYDLNTFSWFDNEQSYWDANANWPAISMLNGAVLEENLGLAMIWFAGDAFKNNVPDLAACQEFFPVVASPWDDANKAIKVQVTPTGWWAYYNVNFALPKMDEVSRIRVVYRVDTDSWDRFEHDNPFHVRLTDNEQKDCFTEPKFEESVQSFWDEPGFRVVDLYYQPNGQTYLALTSDAGGISVNASRPGLYIQQVSVVPVSLLEGDTHVSGNTVVSIQQEAPEIVTIGGEGSINEVAAASKVAEGIYDLQGRKVAKAGKGLYIINGVKTLVK